MGNRSYASGRACARASRAPSCELGQALERQPNVEAVEPGLRQGEIESPRSRVVGMDGCTSAGRLEEVSEKGRSQGRKQAGHSPSGPPAPVPCGDARGCSASASVANTQKSSHQLQAVQRTSCAERNEKMNPCCDENGGSGSGSRRSKRGKGGGRPSGRAAGRGVNEGAQWGAIICVVFQLAENKSSRGGCPEAAKVDSTRDECGGMSRTVPRRPPVIGRRSRLNTPVLTSTVDMEITPAQASECQADRCAIV